jgi:predicted ABC-type ATPase
MKDYIPRLRMFAGPNGSGKSTLKAVLRSELWGVYINPDELEKEISQFDFLDFDHYDLRVDEEEVLRYFQDSPLIEKAELEIEAMELRFTDNKLSFHNSGVNSYFASIAADFIRQKLLLTGRSFSFETVMSSHDKITFLRKAQARGYRTYLYYIATEDPAINISRVQHRVRMGGHPVPKAKIISRYARSLALLDDAIRYSHRAYIFDNSAHEWVWLAEITNGQDLELHCEQLPQWFQAAVWDKFSDKEDLS